jgi:predicted O-methyltransferase YrrM
MRLTRRTVESLLKHNDTSSWELVYADDHSVDSKIRPYVESKGFRPLVLNDGERLGPTRITHKLFVELSARYGAEATVLYLQNDFVSRRPVPVDAVEQLLAIENVGWVHLGYATKFDRRLVRVEPMTIDGEKFKIRTIKYSDRAHVTKAGTNAKYLANKKSERHVVGHVRRAGLRMAYVVPRVMRHAGGKARSTPFKPPGLPAPLRLAQEAWNNGATNTLEGTNRRWNKAMHRKNNQPVKQMKKRSRIKRFRGWALMSRQERDFILQHIPATGYVLEVGTFHGASAAAFAQARPGCQIISVDSFPHGAGNGRKGWGVEPQIRNWLHNKQENMSLIVGDISEAARLFGKLYFDVIIVDGTHTAEACTSDLTRAMPLLKEDGVIVADDYKNPRWPEVAEAVDAFCKTGAAVVFKERPYMAILKKVHSREV